ncbi:MAG TPA: ATP-dependent Clp protease ATP-binding subunit [Candidatus Kapabacteria bacterium]|nr:ATP-dependent Clp protease ATP-binding subunit [Candidatus Kapabacteria bacterium]
MNAKQLLDNLSTHLKNTIARAIALATSLNASSVTPTHLFIALTEETGSIASDVLGKLQIDHNALQKQFLRRIDAEPTDEERTNGRTVTLPQLNDHAKQSLEKAMLIAYERSHTYVGTEHLLYGLLDGTDADLKRLFATYNIDTDAIEDQLDTILQGTTKFPDTEEVTDLLQHMEHIAEEEEDAPHTPSAQAQKHSHKKRATKQPSALDIFSVNLTSSEAQKRIDPVIGREKEIERVIHILCRRNKNNPVLVGEPGVGKTAIVEGLAKKIVAGDVPDILKRKKILSLDLALLIAGTIYRGEFEARLRQIIEEVTQDPNVILFIDEIHNIIGAGSNQGTMDAANILKPALARGTLRCIGATTIDEYTKHIMTDPALERRLQSVTIDEPSAVDATAILQGVKTYYEQFHQVLIPDDVIDTAITLSQKYIHDNYLPDKAIDLIDEAAARVKTKAKLQPTESALMKIDMDIDRYTREKETAIIEERFKDAISLKEKISTLERKRAALEKKTLRKKPLLKKRVTKEDIAAVMSAKLHLDPGILLADEWEKLKALPHRLKEHIVGQDTAIHTLVERLRHAYLRGSDTRQPVASFLFAGPSGIGKTALAKALAKELYHDDKALIKFDMSEFAESHSMSKILGSPAGYIGHNERNRFTDEIKKRPYSVIVFDEFDKAHPDVRRLLLQILDEGELTDSRGKKISFTHAIIILTTNIGAELFKSVGIGFGGDTKERAEKERDAYITNRLKEEFGTDLLSRLASVCVFSPLSHIHLEEIIRRYLATMSGHLANSRHIAITTDQEAVQKIAKEAFNPDLGARHVKHTVEQLVHELITPILDRTKRKKTYRLTTNPEGRYDLK